MILPQSTQVKSLRDVHRIPPVDFGAVRNEIAVRLSSFAKQTWAAGVHRQSKTIRRGLTGLARGNEQQRRCVDWARKLANRKLRRFSLGLVISTLPSHQRAFWRSGKWISLIISKNASRCELQSYGAIILVAIIWQAAQFRFATPLAHSSAWRIRQTSLRRSRHST